MAKFAIRWSEAEASKPYARPLAVTFTGDDGSTAAVALNGPELLYYRQFQAAVLRLLGELFTDSDIENSDSPQSSWLDLIGSKLPAVFDLGIIPVSSFDEKEGRRFHLRVSWDGETHARIDPAVALEYQDFQAALVHQSGHLYRDPDVEDLDDDIERQRQWMHTVSGIIARPHGTHVVIPSWSWR